MQTVTTAELFDACGVLFGPRTVFSPDFLKYIQPSGLKAAYRKKALETHPDRAEAIGTDRSELNDHFIRVNLAYEKLCSVINNPGAAIPKRESVIRKNRKTTFSKQRPDKRNSDHFFSGKIPGRKLLIGQFLYYSGAISWNAFIDSIIWQRRQRPLLGQTAFEWGMLSSKDIHKILMSRSHREKFGECAIRMGYLTPYKLMALLGKQRLVQPSIGEYFVINGNLTIRQMEEMVRKQREHNRMNFSGRFR